MTRAGEIFTFFAFTARIFVRADRNVSYGDLMDVLNGVRTAGFRYVALVGLEGQAAP